MQVVTEMTLPFLPVDDTGFHSNPMPFVERARSVHPWLAKFHSGYVIHGYQALKDLAFMDDKMNVGLDEVVEFYQAHGTPWAQFMEEMLLSHSGPNHTRLRASVAQAFTPRMANQARPLMRKVISELLEEWAPKGEFDFAEFAAFFPISVLCGILGVSTRSIPAIRTSIESHMASLTLDKSLVPEFMAAYDVLWNFVDQLVSEREQQPAAVNGGLLDAVIAAKNAGKMSETELRHLLLVLLIGGYDTSKNMLTMTVYTLLGYPEYWERCACDIKFCGLVIEEMLRYSTIATVYRSVKEEFAYKDHLFPKGTLLAFATPLANRDPDAFEEPMKFDPYRVNTNRHIAFGRGIHVCIGQFLARAQLEEGLHLITQQIKKPRLAGDVSWRPMLGAWGLWTLPLEFEQGKHTSSDQ